MTVKAVNSKKWFSSEKGMIIWTSVIGSIVGAIYADDKALFAAPWWQDFFNGLAVVSVLSGTIIRYVAASSRERSSQLTKNIEQVLIDTSTKMTKNFKRVTYETEIKHYHNMLGRNPILPNLWHFKLRFESQNNLNIEVENSRNSELKESYSIKINGFVDENFGGFMNRFYIAEIKEIRSPAMNKTTLFQVGQIVACSWLGSKQKISLDINDMQGGGNSVHNFSITGITGHVTIHGREQLASSVTPQKRLLDELSEV